ncbi:MAG: long-chain fatty acid--CoA ligase, partial [Pseudomonadota bacterium]
VIGQRLAGDERVLGFVQVAKGREPDPEDLRAFLADRLAGYKRPARIVLVPSLPVAPTGKILKNRLLEEFADRL